MATDGHRWPLIKQMITFPRLIRAHLRDLWLNSFRLILLIGLRARPALGPPRPLRFHFLQVVREANATPSANKIVLWIAKIASQ